MTAFSRVFTPRGRHGESLPVSQPVSGSPADSPYDVTDAEAVDSDPIDASMVYLSTTNPVHFKAGAGATVSDLLLHTGELYRFAWHPGQIASFICPATGTATVYVNAARMV